MRLDAIIGHVVAGRLGTEIDMVAHVLFDEPVAVVAANHGIGQIKILNDRLEFAAVVLGHLATEDGADLVGLADGAIGIEQALSHGVESGTLVEHQIVAVFHLGKEQAVLAAVVLPFCFGKERSEVSQPLLTAGQQILGGERVG
jgi:hypothetical protein